LILILLTVFIVNYTQTQMEETLKSPTQYETGYKIAQAFMELEGNLDFSQFGGLGEGVAAAHSISYYILFPVLLLMVIFGLLLRREISPIRVMTLGLAISYIIALCFFIFFPVPEMGVPASQRHFDIRHFIHRVDRVIPIVPGFGQRIPQPVRRVYAGDDFCLLPLPV